MPCEGLTDRWHGPYIRLGEVQAYLESGSSLAVAAGAAGLGGSCGPVLPCAACALEVCWVLAAYEAGAGACIHFGPG